MTDYEMPKCANGCGKEVNLGMTFCFECKMKMKKEEGKVAAVCGACGRWPIATNEAYGMCSVCNTLLCENCNAMEKCPKCNHDKRLDS